MTKRIAAVLLPVLLLLSGCRHDASELTVVTGIGVDGQSGQYHVGAEVIPLRESGEGQSVFLDTDGKNVIGSIQEMLSMTGRSLYCNHLQIVVAGRETAQRGLNPLLEELLRGTQFPFSLRLAVAKQTAEEILQAKPVISDLHSVEMEDMIQEGTQVCMSPDLNICTFYEEIQSPGIEGILPFLELRENNKEQVCVLGGTALFRGDQMLSVLGEEDTCLLLWMRGKSGGRLDVGDVFLEVDQLKRTIEATPEGGRIKLTLTLKSLENEEEEDQLIQLAQQTLASQCRSLLDRLQQLQCDAVGFGNAIYRTHPKEWESIQDQWPEKFSSYPIEIQVEVRHILWGRIWSTNGNQGEGGKGR